MAGYYGIAPTPPHTGELWAKVVERLDHVDTNIHGILGGEGRVFIITDDDATKPQGEEKEAWGRAVVAPVRRAFDEPEENPGRFRLVPWLLRFDIHPPGRTKNYDPHYALEILHDRAFDRLHGWFPEGITRASLNRPLWRYRPPQALPLWDTELGVWFTSAEYRAWLAPAE